MSFELDSEAAALMVLVNSRASIVNEERETDCGVNNRVGA